MDIKEFDKGTEYFDELHYEFASYHIEDVREINGVACDIINNLYNVQSSREDENIKITTTRYDEKIGISSNIDRWLFLQKNYSNYADELQEDVSYYYIWDYIDEFLSSIDLKSLNHIDNVLDKSAQFLDGLYYKIGLKVAEEYIEYLSEQAGDELVISKKDRYKETKDAIYNNKY